MENFVARPELSGVIAEISGEEFTFRSHPECVDEMTRSSLEMFETLGYV